MGLILTALYTYLRPPVFEADVALLVPQQSIGGSISAKLVQLTGGGSGDTSIYTVKAILESQNALKRVSSETRLPKKYVLLHTDIKEDNVSNSVAVRIQDKDPGIALSIAKSYMSALEVISKQVELPDKRRKIAAMQGRLDKASNTLEIYNKKLKVLYGSSQTAPNVVSSTGNAGVAFFVSPGAVAGKVTELTVKLQVTRGAIDAIQSSTSKKATQGKYPSDLPPSQKWRDRLADLNYQLDVQLLVAGPKDPEVRRLQEQIRVTKQTLRAELEAYSRSVTDKLLDPTSGSQNSDLADLDVAEVATQAELQAVKKLAALAPAEAATLQDVLNVVATQTLIVQQYKLQIEAAELDQSSGANAWEVLDPPGLLDEPINKDYKKNLSFGSILGLLAGVILVVRRARGQQNLGEN